MTSPIPRELVVGATLQEIRHSPYYEPFFVVEGIGPATFRSHYLMLSAGIILELRVSEILMSVMPIDTTPGETKGCALTEVLGQRVTAVAIDDVASPIVVLEGGLFLKDANDGCYGNPLLAGSLEAEYDSAQRREFLDFWTGKPLHLESSAIDSPATGPAT